MAELCKGDGAVNQAMALVSFIEEHKGSRGLIYVNRHSIRGWIIPFLEKAAFAMDALMVVRSVPRTGRPCRGLIRTGN